MTASETVTALEPDPCPDLAETGADSATMAESGMLPDADKAPLDIDLSNLYDSGSSGEIYGNGGGAGDEDWNSLDAIGAEKPNLREHLEQQARLAFSTREELVIAAALIAVLDPAGRLGETAGGGGGGFGCRFGPIRGRTCQNDAF